MIIDQASLGLPAQTDNIYSNAFSSACTPRRAAPTWVGIVRENKGLNLTQSDCTLAESKLSAANDTLKTRLKETLCYWNAPGLANTSEL